MVSSVCIYVFLEQEDTTNVLPLIDLCKSLGVTYLADINIG